MRRRILLALMVCTLTTACGTSVQKEISSGELLQKAAESMKDFAALDVSIKGSVSGIDQQGKRPFTLDLNGQMQDGGKNSTFAFTVLLPLQNTLRLNGSALMLAGKDLYFTLSKVQQSINGFWVDVDDEESKKSLNQWWRVPQTTVQKETVSQSSDGLLPMQLNILRIDEDSGSKMMDGHSVRELTVSIDPKKLKEFLDYVAKQQGKTPTANELMISSLLALYETKGVITIVEDSYLIQKIVWTVHPIQGAPFPVSIDTTVSFTPATLKQKIVAPLDAKIYTSSGFHLPMPTVQPSPESPSL